MKIKRHRLLIDLSLVLFTGLLALPSLESATTLEGDHLISADGMETGKLEVDGTLSVGGSSVDFGTTSLSTKAVQWSYDDAGAFPVVLFDVFEPAAIIQWRDHPSGVPADKMVLTEANMLSVFAPGYSGSSANDGVIRLSPALAVNGGSKVYVDGVRLLTQSDSATFVAQTDGSVTGTLSVSKNISASGGIFTSGNNDFAVAIGTGSKASTSGGVAMGYSAWATGEGAFAVGLGSQATGYNSAAMGHWTTAPGRIALAAGIYTSAIGFAQTVIGANNVAEYGGGTNSPLLTDPIFIVGNGSMNLSSLSPNPSKSNAFLVRYNGKAEVSGDLLVKQAATIQQTITATGDITTAAALNAESAAISQDLEVTGDITGGGAINAATGNFTGRVRIAPQGGISMGEFTYDPDAVE